MRRYGTQSQRVTVPGQDAGLRLVLQRSQQLAQQPAAASCAADIAGLFWFANGEYSGTEQTAIIDAEYPILAVAKVVGEICGSNVEWSAVWEDSEAGEDGPPVVLPDGQALVIAADTETITGTLVVQAVIDGVVYGPISLTLQAGAGAAECGWMRLTDYARTPDSYGAGSEYHEYGGRSGQIYFCNYLDMAFSLPGVTKIWVYTTGSAQYRLNDETTPRFPSVIFSDPDTTGGVVEIDGLSRLILETDGCTYIVVLIK